MKNIIIKILALSVFALAMGYFEGTVVIYLRLALTSTLTSEAVATFNSLPYNILAIEQMREFATIVMLTVVGWFTGKTLKGKFAAFVWAFAIWDLFYYVTLYVLIGWPQSLSTIDVLFLIPVPWIAPVFVPVIISSVSMLISGYVLFNDLKRK